MIASSLVFATFLQSAVVRAIIISLSSADINDDILVVSMGLLSDFFLIVVDFIDQLVFLPCVISDLPHPFL